MLVPQAIICGPVGWQTTFLGHAGARQNHDMACCFQFVLDQLQWRHFFHFQVLWVFTHIP
jgi:hypothetical protein